MLLAGQSGIEFLSTGGNLAYLLLSHIIPTGNMGAYMKIYQVIYASGGALTVLGVITSFSGMYPPLAENEDNWSITAMIIIGFLIIAAVIVYIYRIKTVFAI